MITQALIEALQLRLGDAYTVTHSGYESSRLSHICVYERRPSRFGVLAYFSIYSDHVSVAIGPVWDRRVHKSLGDPTLVEWMADIVRDNELDSKLLGILK